MTPLPPANFDPRAFICTNLVDTDKTMFHAKYLSSHSFGFFKEDFLSFFFRLPWQPEFCVELNSLINF
jgi:hypothetical protein